MARTSNGSVYSATPGGGTQGTDLHTWMSANLGNTAVGSITTIGSGTTERNYWVLTLFETAAEILVYCPNGTSSSATSGMYRRSDGESSLTQPLIFAFAPDGGFQTALSAAQDPALDTFWTYITGTLSLREPTPGFQMMYWRSGSGATHELTMIDDGASPSLIILFHRDTYINSTDYASFAIFSTDLLEVDSVNTNGAGALFVSGNNVANKTYRNHRFWSWDSTSDALILFSNPSASTYPYYTPSFDQIAAGRYPTLSDHPCWRVVMFTSKYIAKLNDYLILHTGVNHTPIATIFGETTTQKYIRVVERFCLGWDETLAAPT